MRTQGDQEWAICESHRPLDPRSHMDPSIPRTFFFGDARDGSFAFAFGGPKRPVLIHDLPPFNSYGHVVAVCPLLFLTPLFNQTMTWTGASQLPSLGFYRKR